MIPLNSQFRSFYYLSFSIAGCVGWWKYIFLLLTCNEKRKNNSVLMKRISNKYELKIYKNRRFISHAWIMYGDRTRPSRIISIYIHICNDEHWTSNNIWRKKEFYSFNIQYLMCWCVITALRLARVSVSRRMKNMATSRQSYTAIHYSFRHQSLNYLRQSAYCLH